MHGRIVINIVCGCATREDLGLVSLSVHGVGICEVLSPT